MGLSERITRTIGKIDTNRHLHPKTLKETMDKDGFVVLPPGTKVTVFIGSTHLGRHILTTEVESHISKIDKDIIPGQLRVSCDLDSPTKRIFTETAETAKDKIISDVLFFAAAREINPDELFTDDDARDMREKAVAKLVYEMELIEEEKRITQSFIGNHPSVQRRLRLWRKSGETVMNTSFYLRIPRD